MELTKGCALLFFDSLLFCCFNIDNLSGNSFTVNGVSSTIDY